MTVVYYGFLINILLFAIQNSVTHYCLTMTRLASMDETSINEIRQIKQYSKLISIELSEMNQVSRHFEDLEYLNTINIHYSEILSNVTTRGRQKLYPSELMDVRLGRSMFYYFESFHQYFALSTNTIHHHIFLQVHTHQVSWIEMMEDLFKSFHSNSFNTFDYC